MLWTILKYFLIFLVSINVRSFPLAWTYRVLTPWFIFKLEEWLHLKRLPRDPKARQVANEAWWENRSPVGKTPFDIVRRRQGWVFVDETDYNLHLSNSCYPKVLDDTRMTWAIEFCPQFLSQQVGGTLPLAATSFLYLKEIPLFASFEVRYSLKTWGDKWVYGVAKFVSRTKRTNSSRKMVAAIGTPSDNTYTPIGTGGLNANNLDTLASKLAAEAEPDGAKVYCVAVSQLCFKIGRITVPPALVFALSGLGSTHSYARLRSMGKGLKPFLSGGWKEEEKWWQGEGDVERVRRERLEVMERIQATMEEAKGW